jgi:hypothetical protein
MLESKKITLKNIRIVHPHLHTKGSFEGKEHLKYQADFIIPKDHPKIKDLIEEIKNQAEEVKTNNKKMLLEFRKDIQCLVDGDTLDKDYYQNSYRLRAKSKKPVLLFDKFRNKIDDETICGSGDYVSAQFSFWAVPKMSGIVGCNLIAVVHMDKGEPIGGGQVDWSEFDDIEVADDLNDEISFI